jgi:CDP-paratose 2-epimerase
VTVLDNLSRKGSARNLINLLAKYGRRVVFEQCDVRNDIKLIAKHMTDADIVYLLAGQVAVTTSVVDPRQDFEINALGTFNVLEAMRDAKSKAILIFASTNKVYGGMEEVRIASNDSAYYYQDSPNGITEDQQLDFHSPYGCSKGAAEQYVRDYSRIYGLRTICFRQSCIYGPNQFGIEDQGWVAWFTIAAIHGKQVHVYGDGKQVRDVLHVDDLIDGYDAAIKNIDKTNGQIYNIGGGSGNVSSLLNLLSLLEHKLGKKIPYQFGDWRPGDQPVYISDITKFSSATGWRPKITFESGINSLIAWTKKNEEALHSVGII